MWGGVWERGDLFSGEVGYVLSFTRTRRPPPRRGKGWVISHWEYGLHLAQRVLEKLFDRDRERAQALLWGVWGAVREIYLKSIFVVIIFACWGRSKMVCVVVELDGANTKARAKSDDFKAMQE